VPNNTFGWGIADALAAVQMADAGGIITTWMDISPAYGTLAPGESVDITITINAPLSDGVFESVLQLTANEPYNHEVQIPVTLTVGQHMLFLPVVRNDD
jgi:hypothetical protein